MKQIEQKFDRRKFIKASGFLTIGFSLFGCNAAGAAKNTDPDIPLGNLPDESHINAWLRIDEDGRITILTGKMELGQGLKTMMQQVAGEELYTNPSGISVILADTGLTPDEGYTAGSRSAEQSAINVRRAAAAAREQLLELASQHFDVEKSSLMMGDGRIGVKGKRKSVSINKLLDGRQMMRNIPDHVVLKDKSEYQWVGKPVPHPDMEAIVTGRALFVQDMRLDGMVHGRVVRPPVYGSQLDSWDDAIRESPGILKVVVDGSFLAVIGEDEYEVVQAAKKLENSAKWKPGPALPEVNGWNEFMSAMDASNRQTQNEDLFHHAVYSKPFIMHGSIGPSCAIAHFEDGHMHVWSHTQGPFPLRSTLSDLLDLPEDNIRVTGVRGPGCYGHNGADDVSADAALLAMAYPGFPVRVQWMREDEHAWEPYGSAMRMELFANLDKSGKINSWDYHLWSDSHSTRPRGYAGNFIASHYLSDPKHLNAGSRVGGGTRNSEPYYNITGPRVADHYVKTPLRVSALRSLGAYANIFAIECFMDELAGLVGLDPFEFRIRHLSDQRAIDVLNELQSMVKSVKPGDGEGLGIGFSRYKNSASYCAVAVKVSVDVESQKIMPLGAWSVIEAGETFNPDGLKNQTEGGIIQAISWTLMEEVNFEPGRITSRDWDSYPIIRFDQIPEIEVRVIDRPELPPLGAGEAAQGPAGAALANAVYNACGKRIRDLPLQKHMV